MKRFVATILLAAILIPHAAIAQEDDLFIDVTKVIQNENALPGETFGYSFTAIVHEDVEATQDTYLVMFATFADRLFGEPLINVEQQILAYPELLDFGAQRSAHTGQLEENGIVQDVGVLFVLYGQVLYVWWGIGFDAQPLDDLMAIAQRFQFRWNLGANPSDLRLETLVPAEEALPTGYDVLSFEITDRSASTSASTPAATVTKTTAETIHAPNCLAVLSDEEVWTMFGDATQHTVATLEDGSFTVAEFEGLIDEWGSVEARADILADAWNDEPVFVALAEFAEIVQEYLQRGIDTGQVDDADLKQHRDEYFAIHTQVGEACGSD